MSVVKHITLAGIDLPITVEEMEAAPAFSGQTVKFFFTYRNIRFAACFEDDGRQCNLKIVGDAGYVPFTAESPEARSHLSHILRIGGSHTRGGLREVNGRIVVGRDVVLKRPITAVLVMTGLVQALVPMVPYIDLLSTYVRPPMEPAKPGERQLRPQWRRKK